MATERKSNSTTPTATSLPHFTELVHSHQISDHPNASLPAPANQHVYPHVPTDSHQCKTRHSDQELTSEYPNAFQHLNYISESNVKASHLQIESQMQKCHTLGYYKSEWSLQYPTKHAQYIELKEDLNATCCGGNVVELGRQISRYNSEILNSPWKICFCFPGSFCYYFCYKKWLVIESFVYELIFFAIVFATILNPYDLIPNTIAHINSLGTLVAFFLGLYVSLSVARWWRLRTDGVGSIWSASSGMAMFLGPMYEVYRDSIYKTRHNRKEFKEGQKQLQRILIHLKRIQRYCQISMAMIFRLNGQDGFDYDDLEELEIISHEDRDQFEPLGSKQQEYAWTLVSREIRMMMEECPEFMDSNTILTLLQLCAKGRTGAALIAGQLGTQLPLTYAHGVTLICKLYNIVLCITSAIDFVTLWLEDIKSIDHDHASYETYTNIEIVSDSAYFFSWNLAAACLALLVRTSSISLLLQLCQQLANPFDNDITAYPGLRYVKGIYLSFEILLGFEIKTQWQRICGGHYEEMYMQKQRELEDLNHMAQDCGILHDPNRQSSLQQRRDTRKTNALDKENEKSGFCCCKCNK